MPAFSLLDTELAAIAAFVPSLRKPTGVEGTAAGDAPAGERLFAGKGGCFGCHMVGGRGGVLGPDHLPIRESARSCFYGRNDGIDLGA